MTEADLAPMKKYHDRLALFMDCNFLPQLFGDNSTRKDEHKNARKFIFEQNGTDIVPRKLYTIEDNENMFEESNESSDDESCGESDNEYDH